MGKVIVVSVLACVAAGCQPMTSMVSPTPVTLTTVTVGGPSVDVCEAIRSGRIKPFVPVVGC